MRKVRVQMTVTVDLDGLPGEFHAPQNAALHIRRMLEDCIPHYNPTVGRATRVETEWDRKSDAEKEAEILELMSQQSQPLFEGPIGDEY